MVDGQARIDLYIDGERVSRIDVPDMVRAAVQRHRVRRRARARLPQQLGIDVEFTRPDSARLQHHFFDAIGQRLVFVD